MTAKKQQEKIEEATTAHDEKIKHMQATIARQQADIGGQNIELEENLLQCKRKIEESCVEVKRYKKMVSDLEKKEKEVSFRSEVSFVAQSFCKIAGKYTILDFHLVVKCLNTRFSLNCKVARYSFQKFQLYNATSVPVLFRMNGYLMRILLFVNIVR